MEPQIEQISEKEFQSVAIDETCNCSFFFIQAKLSTSLLRLRFRMLLGSNLCKTLLNFERHLAER